MKRQIPRGVPRILPFVGHGDDVGVEQMAPYVIAPMPASFRGRRLSGIAIEPVANDVVIKLLGPEHPRERLAHDVLCVGREVLGYHGSVEFVCLALSRFKDLFKLTAQWVYRLGRIGQAQADGRCLTRWNGQLISE